MWCLSPTISRTLSLGHNDAVGRAVPPHPNPLPKEREPRQPFRVGGTAWCMRPLAVEEAKAGSPLRSAPALHRVELNCSGSVLLITLNRYSPLHPFP